jgi:hypothetical protein
MRACLTVMLGLVLACQSTATQEAAPPIEVRREPANRAALNADPLRERLDEREAVPPPNGPVIPQADFGRCLRSRMCGFEGLCSPSEGELCIAASNADCKDSDACRGGRCTAKDGVCIAASDDDCRTSWACRAWGRCFHDGHEACSAKLAKDCRKSTRCQREGECKLVGNVCAK